MTESQELISPASIGNTTPRATNMSKLPLDPPTIATRVPVPIASTGKNKAKTRSQFSIVCSNRNARNITLFLGLYYTVAVAGGLLIPVYGAYWFGGCIESDTSIVVDETDCDPDYSRYNLWLQIFVSIAGLLQFLFAGFFGRLSDSFGRKWFIFLAIIFYAVPRGILIFYVNLFLYWSLSLFVDIPTFVFGAAFADIFHGSQTLKTVAYSLLYAMGGLGLFMGALWSVGVSAIFGNNHSVFISIGFAYIFMLLFWMFGIYISFLVFETYTKIFNKNRYKRDVI